MFIAAILALAGMGKGRCETLSLEGVTVTPHLQSHQMRYRKKTDFSLGARTQLIIQNVSESPLSLEPDADIRLRDRTPKELLDADEWAWYDFPDAWQDQPLTLAPEALTVWTCPNIKDTAHAYECVDWLCNSYWPMKLKKDQVLSRQII